MPVAPVARVALRYGIGYLAGSGAGEALAMDPDAVNMLALAMAAAVEGIYAYAKKKGWAT